LSNNNGNNDLSCLATTKITIAQSNLLDEMARSNNSTRSYELRMILELYGRERLHIDADRRELLEADRACQSLYELYKEVYPVKDSLSSVPWYTGILLLGVNFVGLLELEMLNKSSRMLLFRYTYKYFPPIEKRYPEIALILERIIQMTGNDIVELEALQNENCITYKR